VRNQTRVSGPRSATIRNGGFDPIAVVAEVDDELLVTVSLTGGLSVTYVARVPRKRPPEIVRTNPSKGRTDVALNVQIEVIFSEPLDKASITASTVFLTSDGIVAGSLRVSPDGLAALLLPTERLKSGTTYTLTVENVRDLDGDSLGGRSEITFTTGDGTIAPALSGEVAFVSERDGNTELYRARVDGTDPIRLTNNQGYDGEPSWSPDGTRLAFVSARERSAQNELLEKVDVYIMNADGANVVRVTTTGFARNPTWSADGRTLAYRYDAYPYGAGDIAVINVDIGESSRNYLGLKSLDVAEPTWSPDGTRIAFVSRKTWWMGSDILSVRPDGSAIATVLGRTAGNFGAGRVIGFSSPSWSPDGKRLAAYFCRGYAMDECDQGIGIVVASSDGSEIDYLIDDGSWPYKPVWSPDGKAIAFNLGWCNATICGNDLVYTTTGGGSRGLIAANARDAAWRPSQ